MPATQPEHAIVKALDLIKEKLLGVARVRELVDHIDEAFGARIALSEEGVWLFAVDEEYTYATRGVQEDPTDSRARVTLALQFGRQKLDRINRDRPVSAMAMIAGDVRQKIEAESAAGTWREFTAPGETAVSGMEVTFVSKTTAYAEGLNIAAMEIVIDVRGYHEGE